MGIGATLLASGATYVSTWNMDFVLEIACLLVFLVVLLSGIPRTADRGSVPRLGSPEMHDSPVSQTRCNHVSGSLG